MAAVLFTSCAVEIHDEQFCSPLPDHLGAVCDNFLTANQIILQESEWQNLQKKWMSEGQAVECTQSKTLGDIKGEIEKLCSLAPCNYTVQQNIISGLNKIQNLGKPALH